MSVKGAVAGFVEAFRADFNFYEKYGAKYHKDHVTQAKVAGALVTKIGLQMSAGIRLMQALDAANIPVAPQVVCRLIRHLYSAEIHWKAKIAPGVSIVHGNGLVISRDATVGPGCILFHNVTLGRGIDPDTRAVGAPTLGANVHVGPGATLIGPIHIGDGSKIMAGAVVTESVPDNSLVRSVPITVSARGNGASENMSTDLEQS
jgi:serine O-acetyltransferase